MPPPATAWRGGEGQADPRLRSLAAEAQRAGSGATLALKRLALADVLEMVRSLVADGADLPEGIGGQLYHETEGLPFFLAAYFEALLGDGGAPGRSPRACATCCARGCGAFRRPASNCCRPRPCLADLSIRR